jgi:hypothetical protein
MDNSGCPEKNLRTQIWGGKDKRIRSEAEECLRRNFDDSMADIKPDKSLI